MNSISATNSKARDRYCRHRSSDLHLTGYGLRAPPNVVTRAGKRALAAHTPRNQINPRHRNLEGRRKISSAAFVKPIVPATDHVTIESDIRLNWYSCRRLRAARRTCQDCARAREEDHESKGTLRLSFRTNGSWVNVRGQFSCKEIDSSECRKEIGCRGSRIPPHRMNAFLIVIRPRVNALLLAAILV